MTTLEQEVMDVKTRLEHLEAVIRRLLVTHIRQERQCRLCRSIRLNSSPG